MAKRLEFYNPGGKPITTSNYIIRTTLNGRKQAVATVKDKGGEFKTLYRFVSSDFKKKSK